MNGHVLIVVSVLGWCKVGAGSTVTRGTRGSAATTALYLPLTQLSVFLFKMMTALVSVCHDGCPTVRVALASCRPHTRAAVLMASLVHIIARGNGALQ